jgi:putative methyltransferase
MNFYAKCSGVLDEMDKTGSSFKSCIYKMQKELNFGKIYAVCLSVVKHKPVLSKVANFVVNNVTEHREIDMNLLMVLLEEVLLRGSQPKTSSPLLSHIRGLSDKIKIQYGTEVKQAMEKSSQNKEIRSIVYFRCNDQSGKAIAKLAESNYQVSKDDLVEDLYYTDYKTYSLINKTDFKIINNKDFVIQSKASCFPIAALKEAIGEDGQGVFVESCAAPGNKTLQLSKYFANNRIISFERDKPRFYEMKKRLKLYGSCPFIKNIKLLNSDFFTSGKVIGHVDRSKVEYAAVDPSCSGSGMLNRLSDFSQGCKTQEEFKQFVLKQVYTRSKTETQRIRNLANFQYKLISFTIETFPNLKYLVYSTCSLYREENEDIVKKVLDKHPEITLANVFADKWPIRAFNFYEDPKYDIMSHAIRENPFLNNNDGFFTVVFKIK